MGSFEQFWAAQGSNVLLGIGVLLLVQIGLTIAVVGQNRRLRAEFRTFFGAAQGDTIEALLKDHLHARQQMEAQLTNITNRVGNLEELMKGSKRFVGLVRYDAFEDVGGQQSFALAIYDERGNGAVITSIIGRMDCRVYCKPIVNFQSERTLSQEETRAIREARTDVPKSILS